MYREKDNAWFERQMQQACGEARRICRPSGVGVFVFANKETAAWEAMLGALIGAGWIVTSSWPVDTESGNRLRAKDSAALVSSVHLVCRPREDADGHLNQSEVGDWREILAELPIRTREWMARLASEGGSGCRCDICLYWACSRNLFPLQPRRKGEWRSRAAQRISGIRMGCRRSGSTGPNLQGSRCHGLRGRCPFDGNVALDAEWGRCCTKGRGRANDRRRRR